MFAQSVPPERTRRRAVVWRDASLHSDLCLLERRARDRGAGATSSPSPRRFALRRETNSESRSRFDGGDIPPPVWAEADVRVWKRGPPQHGDRFGRRRRCALLQILWKQNFYRNAAAFALRDGGDHRRDVFLNGTPGGVAGANILRVAEQGHVFDFD